MNCRSILAVGFGMVILAGCACGPAQWATRAQLELRCGQTVEQVAQVVQRDVRRVDVADERRTHLVRDGGTDLWLVFGSGGLRTVQVAWTYQMTNVAMGPRWDLCASDRAK
jgi:hypothetical protein